MCEKENRPMGGYYVGLDVHSRECVVVIVRAGGRPARGRSPRLAAPELAGLGAVDDERGRRDPAPERHHVLEIEGTAHGEGCQMASTFHSSVPSARARPEPRQLARLPLWQPRLALAD